MSHTNASILAAELRALPREDVIQAAVAMAMALGLLADDAYIVPPNAARDALALAGSYAPPILDAPAAVRAFMSARKVSP